MRMRLKPLPSTPSLPSPSTNGVSWCDMAVNQPVGVEQGVTWWSNGVCGVPSRTHPGPCLARHQLQALAMAGRTHSLIVNKC
jgi:hypothetical protein